MTDDAFDRYREIWSKVHDLVDELTQGLSEDDEEDVRQKLTDEFRFWKRMEKNT